MKNRSEFEHLSFLFTALRSLQTSQLYAKSLPTFLFLFNILSETGCITLQSLETLKSNVGDRSINGLHCMCCW